MNILACGVIYNEMDIFPYLLEHYKSQDVEMFVFDNYSDDGTWEYLNDHKIECERLDTGGKLSTITFMESMMAKWRERKPDWCIYMDADEFPLTSEFSTLKELVEDRDEKGFNVLRQERVNFRPVGTEDYSRGDPLKIYRYYFHELPHQHPKNERIFKFSEEISVIPTGGHFVTKLYKNISHEPLDNPIFHYTIREGAKEKIIERVVRRNKDEETTEKGWNVHYQTFVDDDKWLWNKDELNDAEDPEGPFYKFVHKQQ